MENTQKIAEIGKKSRLKNREKSVMGQKEYRDKNREKINEQARLRYKELVKNPDFRKKLNQRRKEIQKQCRLECLVHYGGNPPKCQCCGESHIEFLEIDHINGGGSKENKLLRKLGFRDIYHYLKRFKYPNGYRVLCSNCNKSIGRYGYCPHQKK